MKKSKLTKFIEKALDYTYELLWNPTIKSVCWLLLGVVVLIFLFAPAYAAKATGDTPRQWTDQEIAEELNKPRLFTEEEVVYMLEQLQRHAIKQGAEEATRVIKRLCHRNGEIPFEDIILKCHTQPWPQDSKDRAKQKAIKKGVDLNRPM